MSVILKEKWKDPEYREARSQQMKDLWQDEEHRKNFIKNVKENAKKNWQNPEYRKKMCKSVVNIETGMVFESGAAAARWCNINRGNITKAVKTGRQAGRHPETNEPLHWRYAEEGGEL